MSEAPVEDRTIRCEHHETRPAWVSLSFADETTGTTHTRYVCTGCLVLALHNDSERREYKVQVIQDDDAGTARV